MMREIKSREFIVDTSHQKFSSKKIQILHLILRNKLKPSDAYL
jgi:hypothetical protein